MKIWIISFVAYGDRTETVQIFDSFFCSRKAAEEMAKWLRNNGHTAVKVVSLTQAWQLRPEQDVKLLRYWRDKRKNALNQYIS